MVNIERQGSPESWSREELVYELHEGILKEILIKDGQELRWWLGLFATKFRGEWVLYNADKFPLIMNAVTGKRKISTEIYHNDWRGIRINRYPTRNRAKIIFKNAVLPNSLKAEFDKL